MYQQITIVGNVGRDPEMRYTQSGAAICDFSVATTERWTDKQSNEQKEKTTWFRISCWNKLAETVNQYVQKGRQVMVVGTVDVSAWIDKQGEPAATLEVRAQTVKFLSKKDDTPAQGGDFAGSPPATADIPF